MTPWRSIRRATQPARFGLRHKLLEKRRGGTILRFRSDRLLHCGKAPFQDSCAGQLVDLPNQSRPEPRQGIELFGAKKIDRAGHVCRPLKVCVFEAASEVEVVGGSSRDRDPHARTIDILGRTRGRTLPAPGRLPRSPHMRRKTQYSRHAPVRRRSGRYPMRRCPPRRPPRWARGTARRKPPRPNGPLLPGPCQAKRRLAHLPVWFP